ncbi:MAG: hypothetical protein KDM64_05220 [Verrucomicrobiae bacterium]|nr:hypothetical protein [Verrucomicrobiae bacterium]
MELLVVVSLIAILAALVLAAAGGILKKIKRDQIRAFMAEIETGLEDFKVDNAIYPMNPKTTGGTFSDATAIEGSAVLYDSLSGDTDKDGTVNDDATVYVERLDWWSNSGGTTGKAPETRRSVPSPSGTGYIIVDPLGSPMRYIAAAYGTSQDHQKEREKLKQRNPTFDLWSVAGAAGNPPDFSDESTWITNWGSN